MAIGDIPLTLVGNLTADPELRFTPSGQAVANFTVASTARFLDRQTNEWKDGDTVFIRCSVWRQYAENVAESLTKGTRVIVTGKLKVRQYETREGGKGTSVECEVDEVGPALRTRPPRSTGSPGPTASAAARVVAAASVVARAVRVARAAAASAGARTTRGPARPVASATTRRRRSDRPALPSAPSPASVRFDREPRTSPIRSGVSAGWPDASHPARAAGPDRT